MSRVGTAELSAHVVGAAEAFADLLAERMAEVDPDRARGLTLARVDLDTLANLIGGGEESAIKHQAMELIGRVAAQLAELAR